VSAERGRRSPRNKISFAFCASRHPHRSRARRKTDFKRAPILSDNPPRAATTTGPRHGRLASAGVAFDFFSSSAAFGINEHHARVGNGKGRARNRHPYGPWGRAQAATIMLQFLVEGRSSIWPAQPGGLIGILSRSRQLRSQSNNGRSGPTLIDPACENQSRSRLSLLRRPSASSSGFLYFTPPPRKGGLTWILLTRLRYE